MPKGMSLPLRVTHAGGAAMLVDALVVRQNIVLGLMPAGSLHPWNQELTPEEDLVFEIKDRVTSGLYATHVRQIFAELERLGFARLLPGPKGISMLPASSHGESGDMIVQVNYVNLENGTPEQMSFPIRGGRF